MDETNRIISARKAERREGTLRPKATRATRTVASNRRGLKHGWRAYDALTNAEVLKAARSDLDAQPLTDAQLQRINAETQRSVGAGIVTGAVRGGSPYSDRTLRDWEQGRVKPDATLRAYLTVIARNPNADWTALEPAA